MKKELTIICVALLTTLSGWKAMSQEIKIKSFSLQMEPLTVPMQRKDSNGNVCALVKVIIPSAQAVFEGSLVGNCDFKTSEYWCYLSPGSKLLKVKYPNCEPLMVNFESIIGSGVKGGSVYELVLSVPADNAIEIIGSPLKIKYSQEKSPTAYLNDMGVFHDKETYYQSMLGKKRSCDKIDSLILTLKSAGNVIKAEEVLSADRIDNYLLSGVEPADILTIIPDNDSYAVADCTISNQDIKNQFVSISLAKKRVEIRGMVLDSVTNKPVPDAVVNIFQQGAQYNALLGYHVYAYYTSFPLEYNKNRVEFSQKSKMEHRYIRPIGECPTNNDGEFAFADFMENYTYFIDVIPPAGYLVKTGNNGLNYNYHSSPDLIINVAPNTLCGVVTDGKNPIKGARIECDALYGNIFYSDDDGKYIIDGYKNSSLRITAPDFTPLNLNPLPSWNNDYSHKYIINLRKGKTNKTLSGHYDLVKNKVIYD